MLRIVTKRLFTPAVVRGMPALGKRVKCNYWGLQVAGSAKWSKSRERAERHVCRVDICFYKDYLYFESYSVFGFYFVT